MSDMTSSLAIRQAYTTEYYTEDCGGFDAYKKNQGKKLEDPRLQIVAAIASLKRQGRVLDLGCGRGELTYHFAQKGFSVTAIDYSPEAIQLAQKCFEGEESLGTVKFFCDDVGTVALQDFYDLAVAADIIEHLSFKEVDLLYQRTAQHLKKDGLLVVHTFPNLWYYKYEYPRRRRVEAGLGIELPAQPRTQYETLMHINEQSPRILKKQLAAHFEHVLLWFGDIGDPGGSLLRKFSVRELRSAPSLFAIASQCPIEVSEVKTRLQMCPLPVILADEIKLRVRKFPERVFQNSEFDVELEITNDTNFVLNSYSPNPIHIAYRWLNNQEIVVLDGQRSKLDRPLPSGTQDCYHARVKAPSESGHYILRLTLVQEHIRWLDQESTHFHDVPIEVQGGAIEVNNPEIDVDELMQKVREEVAKRELPLVEEASNLNLSNLNLIEPVHLDNIVTLLENAEFKSQVRTEIPQKFQRFPFNVTKQFLKLALKLYAFLFKEQRAVNFSLIQALKESLALHQQLIEQVTSLQLQVNRMSDRLATTESRLATTELRLATTEAATETRFTATELRLATTEAATETRFTATESRLAAMNERHLKNDYYLKNDLVQQKRLITMFLEEARQRLPEPLTPAQLQDFVNQEQHLLDAFYVAFEEQFRGSREEISNRLKVYLPLLEEAKVGTPEFPILDVGCGRGEWLKLLRESGYVAKGIDLNRVMLDECRSRGLEATESDVLDYLQSLPDASLGAVTGFHIIEHLRFPVLIEVMHQTVRVLKPGGLGIFETPNPQNILVGSNNFYIDPTHRNPLPTTLTKFLLEHAGLSPVKVMNLNAYADSYKVSGTEVAERFNEYFYGAQDYAVVGYKV